MTTAGQLRALRQVKRRWLLASVPHDLPGVRARLVVWDDSVSALGVKPRASAADGRGVASQRAQVNLGRAIRLIRRRDAVTNLLHDVEILQAELARRTGIDAGDLSRIESGRANPTWSTV